MPAALPTTLAQAIANLESQFNLDTETLNGIVKHFLHLYEYGLENKGAAMAMIPSFVTGVPNGTEKGTYLALDLGGTNLRVCEVNLDGKGSFEIKQEKYKVSDALKSGPAAALFEYIARSVDQFLTDYGSSSKEDELLMGFTFSFPVEQTAIDKGTLISWTKGFNCPDAIGKDVVKLLQDALDRKHIKVRVNALVNDTVGALLARGYQTNGALLGAIFGTGTNGAYVEKIEKVKKLKAKVQGGPKEMIINTEWGGFDDVREVLPITQYDNFVDRTAIRQRHHVFEKMISGLYLGEVARAVFIDLIDHLHLFSGFSSEKMNSQYGFDTAYVSAVEGDTKEASDPTNETRKVLVSTMGIQDKYISERDIQTVRKVCTIVSTRAARLSATAIATTLIHTGNVQSKNSPKGTEKEAKEARDENQKEKENGKEVEVEDEGVEVGVDGSVVEFLPFFQDRMREALRDMVGEEAEKRTRFGLAKDGSGVGAALCALQALKQEQSGHRVEE